MFVLLMTMIISDLNADDLVIDTLANLRPFCEGNVAYDFAYASRCSVLFFKDDTPAETRDTTTLKALFLSRGSVISIDSARLTHITDPDPCYTCGIWDLDVCKDSNILVYTKGSLRSYVVTINDGTLNTEYFEAKSFVDSVSGINFEAGVNFFYGNNCTKWDILSGCWTGYSEVLNFDSNFQIINRVNIKDVLPSACFFLFYWLDKNEEYIIFNSMEVAGDGIDANIIMRINPPQAILIDYPDNYKIADPRKTGIYQLRWGGPDNLIVMIDKLGSAKNQLGTDILFYDMYGILKDTWHFPYWFDNYKWDQKDSVLVLFSGTEKVVYTAKPKELAVKSKEEISIKTSYLTSQIKFNLGAKSTSLNELDILDINGSLVHTFSLTPGQTEISWLGTDSQDNQLPSGIYFARAEDEKGNVTTAKVVLVR